MPEIVSPELLAALREVADARGAGVYRGDVAEGLARGLIERGLVATVQVPVATVPKLVLTNRGAVELQCAAAAPDDRPFGV